MKTRITILSGLLAALTFVSVNGGYKSVKQENKCIAQVTSLLERNLDLTKNVDQTTATVFIKVDENGVVKNVKVYHADIHFANEIKQTIQKEKFQINKDEAGLYRLKITFKNSQ